MKPGKPIAKTLYRKPFDPFGNPCNDTDVVAYVTHRRARRLLLEITSLRLRGYHHPLHNRGFTTAKRVAAARLPTESATVGSR
jgi:hypothetical protein